MNSNIFMLFVCFPVCMNNSGTDGTMVNVQPATYHSMAALLTAGALQFNSFGACSCHGKTYFCLPCGCWWLGETLRGCACAYFLFTFSPDKIHIPRWAGAAACAAHTCTLFWCFLSIKRENMHAHYLESRAYAIYTGIQWLRAACASPFWCGAGPWLPSSCLLLCACLLHLPALFKHTFWHACASSCCAFAAALDKPPDRPIPPAVHSVPCYAHAFSPNQSGDRNRFQLCGVVVPSAPFLGWANHSFTFCLRQFIHSSPIHTCTCLSLPDATHYPATTLHTFPPSVLSNMAFYPSCLAAAAAHPTLGWVGGWVDAVTCHTARYNTIPSFWEVFSSLNGGHSAIGEQEDHLHINT